MKKILLIAILFTWSLMMFADTKQDATKWNTPQAGNPFIPGYFADPTIKKFGDTYYLYATTDGTGNGYGPAQVWVSKDFRNWTNRVMDWPTTEVVWAPDGRRIVSLFLLRTLRVARRHRRVANGTMEKHLRRHRCGIGGRPIRT